MVNAAINVMPIYITESRKSFQYNSWNGSQGL